MELSTDTLIQDIQAGNITVCTIGIGRIGLPTALSFAKAGLETIGVDINKNLVHQINSGKFPLKDEPGYDTIFDDVLKNRKFLFGDCGCHVPYTYACPCR